MNNDFDWTGAAIAKLRQLWATGMSTVKMAAEIGVSKNALVGKAHRLNLPPRPSPIRRGDGAPKPKAPPRAPANTLPPLFPEVPSEVQVPVVYWSRQPDTRPERIKKTSVLPKLESVPGDTVVDEPPALRPLRKIEPCCWPIGEPGKPGFRYCDAPSTGGRLPYCEEHYGIGVVSARDRHEEAA